MERSTRKRYIATWLIGILIVVLICIYVGVAIYYNDRFYPHTTINGIEFGNAVKADVMDKVGTQLLHYNLEISGRDLQTGEKTILFTIISEEIDLCATIKDEEIQSILEQQNNFLWPVHIWKQYVYDVHGDVSYNTDKLTSILNSQSVFDDNLTILPKDAYIKGYSEETKEYIIEPEVMGTRLDYELAKAAIVGAISQYDVAIDLDEMGCYMQPMLKSTDEALQQNVSDASNWLRTEITYDWNTNKVILTGEQIKEWVVQDNNTLKLDEVAIEDFVDENASKYDTYGKSRVFHTTLGYDLTLPSGAFGWLTDREAETKALIELIKAGTVGEREPVYAFKAPWRGMNDVGNSYVEADLTNQHLYLYKNGSLVLETDFVSGDMSKNYDTPEGVFGITYKTTDAILRGGDYAEHVSYWMPYHGNYGMHDATWRQEFGGDIYQNNGSHGCINLPLDKAGEIYQQVSEGFPVICYYYPPGVLPEPEVYDDWDDEDD